MSVCTASRCVVLACLSVCLSVCSHTAWLAHQLSTATPCCCCCRSCCFQLAPRRRTFALLTCCKRWQSLNVLQLLNGHPCFLSRSAGALEAEHRVKASRARQPHPWLVSVWDTHSFVARLCAADCMCPSPQHMQELCCFNYSSAVNTPCASVCAAPLRARSEMSPWSWTWQGQRWKQLYARWQASARQTRCGTTLC